MEHTAKIRSPWSFTLLFHLGGAVGDVAKDATAYPHRRSAHSLNINGV